MNNDWIKIDDDIIYVKEYNVSVQFSIMSHAVIDIALDLVQYPQYLNYFFNLFQNHSKFNLSTKKFIGKGTLIKSVDYDLDFLHISMRCDLLETSDISERRDEIIDNLLNNEDKNNII